LEVLILTYDSSHFQLTLRNGDNQALHCGLSDVTVQLYFSGINAIEKALHSIDTLTVATLLHLVHKSELLTGRTHCSFNYTT